ncbi:hypothetical protein [Rhodococcus sp. CH91]|uniref:hypothetical protein n=1 Tax=Rhodococcus sp. CH91 TaxID=2910256 RepID=UPI001F4B8681|nr:hypothetical protein [Rhodococcus sp. CH91]
MSDSLRILVYSDDAAVRQQVRDALGTRLHPDLPPLHYVEVATPPVVVERMQRGDIDLAVLDGEAAPAGGMGLARQLEDELDRCPPIVVLIARADDEWLARWSGAEVAMRHPVDPIRLGRQVLALLSSRSRPA